MKSVSLHTLGCKLNYSETSSLLEKFRTNGFQIKEYGQDSDVFVLNTCSVTDTTDKECRQIVRSVLNSNPDTYVIVTGCYAQLQPEEIASISGVDLVLGSKEKLRLFDYVNGFEKKSISCVFTSPLNELTDFDYAYSSDTDSRTRAFLKIQDGCDYSCSYCTIPLARGRSRSLAVSDVINNAKKLIDSGYKEIILTGVNTGDYRYETGVNGDLKKFRLVDVLYGLDKLDIPRIRISSIEPNLLSNEIIQLVKSSSKFCKHFHIPLQSGDDKILGLMKRRYNTELFSDLISRVNTEIPEAGIGVDIITGFPGESEESFIKTTDFIKELNISYLHVFTYSERKNTTALRLSGKVDISERKRRSKILRQISTEKKQGFFLKNKGKVHTVLLETEKEDGSISGFTGNYIKVRIPSNSNYENTLLQCRITDAIGQNFCTGEIISD
jgi:threonylcarbamoyladenosine tRNA methylthiotransferase MtaB